MVDITELLWDDQNIAHIARHNVTVVEVSEVVFGESALFSSWISPIGGQGRSVRCDHR